MSSTSTVHYNFPRGLYLDRKRARYTFRANSDTVLVVNAHEAVDLDDLAALYHPYEPREVDDPRKMFDGEVLSLLRDIEKDAGGGALLELDRESPLPSTPAETGEHDVPAGGDGAKESVDEPASEAEARDPGDGSTLVELESSGAPRLVEISHLPAARRVTAVREQCESLMRRWLELPDGEIAIIRGNHDGEIRAAVTEMCGQLAPHHLLQGQSVREPGGEPPTTTAERPMAKALTSQAFGNQLSLGDVERFLLAKSALAQTLSTTGYRRILEMKGYLLAHGPSASLEAKLCHYYRGVRRYLESKDVEKDAVRLVERSKHIYLPAEADQLDAHSMALGVTDAFLALKHAGCRNAEVLDVLMAHVRRSLPGKLQDAVRATELLLRATCYSQLGGDPGGESDGTYADFFLLRNGHGAWIALEVHASSMSRARHRALLVEALAELPDRSDPARTLVELNRFCLQRPFPRNVRVSLFYGVLEPRTGGFTFASAAHSPPYRVRGERIDELDDNSGPALNSGESEYRSQRLTLRPRDCLVAYTDGALENETRQANAARSRSFPLESGPRRALYGRLAREAADTILAAARDELSEPPGDVRIQVYRHI